MLTIPLSLYGTDEEFLSLKEIGIQSNKDGFVINEQKVKVLNEKIWNEIE